MNDDLKLEQQPACRVCGAIGQAICSRDGCPSFGDAVRDKRKRRRDLVAIEDIVDALAELDREAQTRVLICAGMLYGHRLEQI